MGLGVPACAINCAAIYIGFNVHAAFQNHMQQTLLLNWILGSFSGMKIVCPNIKFKNHINECLPRRCKAEGGCIKSHEDREKIAKQKCLKILWYEDMWTNVHRTTIPISQRHPRTS